MMPDARQVFQQELQSRPPALSNPHRICYPAVDRILIPAKGFR